MGRLGRKDPPSLFVKLSRSSASTLEALLDDWNPKSLSLVRGARRRRRFAEVGVVAGHMVLADGFCNKNS